MHSFPRFGPAERFRLELRQMADSRHIAETVTLHAINRTDRVGAHSTEQQQADRSRIGWGGARNRSISTGLSLKNIEAIFRAAERADATGRPFNRFVTVHWSALDVDDGDAARMTGRLIKLASDWCATKGVKMPWAWVRENDDGDGSKGSHVHILLHCPADLLIGRLWRRWIRRVTNRPYCKGAVRSEVIGRTLNTCMTNPTLYADDLQRLLNYVCKSLCCADAAGLGIPSREPAGRIIGKRAGWWQIRDRSRNPYAENARTHA
jgi:hypothetical protein